MASVYRTYGSRLPSLVHEACICTVLVSFEAVISLVQMNADVADGFSL
jgi:hypothetical protein